MQIISSRGEIKSGRRETSNEMSGSAGDGWVFVGSARFDGAVGRVMDREMGGSCDGNRTFVIPRDVGICKFFSKYGR